MHFQVGHTFYDEDEAEFVLAGYGFGEEARATTPVGQRYGEVAHDVMVARYGYRTYDCIEADPGPRLGDRDLLVTAGLNGRLNVRALASLMAVREEASDALEQQALKRVRFWDVEPSEIAELDGAEPGELDQLRARSRLWGLYRAWYVLMAAPDVETALTHKILHHKLPALAPLLDRKTEPVLRRVAEERGLSSSWAVVLADIQTQPHAFERLEAYFASLASARRSRRLTRLRIHDILVWSDVTSRREDAANLGRNLPNR